MSDHHDDFGSFDEHHEPLPFDDTPGHDDTPIFDHEDHEVWADDADTPGYHPSHDFSEESEVGGGAEHGGVEDHASGDDGDHWADYGDHPDPAGAATDHIDVFPPTLDVGDLPEPVDGFPWIDIGSLGTAEPTPIAEHIDPVRPQELAEYAGEQIPPGADGWATLADSDDPATSALARWWNHN